ncbi:asparaginase domain-containing protein [Plantactinospora siamensis]|uniref:Asparaginase domain-containing protein n=1 Tax=Plantactinospora siamensis TaxID=555372 RepID=A0ABV6P017_9ACTN
MTTNLTVFFLGGTIGMAGHRAGVVHRLTGAELVEAVPQLADVGANLAVRDFRALPSACLSFADILELADAADAAVAAGADGIVVVQGTDTIEETAYLIDLVWSRPAPVVVTGAMRNPRLAGADGPANLLAAARVAASGAFAGLGCLVVANDQVHAARHVRKTHSANPATFAAPNTGPIGILAEDRAVLLTRPAGRVTLPRPRPDAAAAAPVALHTVALDDDGGQLVGLADRYAGLVVAGFGVGHVPAALAEPLGELARRIPVVLASRTGAGPVFTATYGFAGSERDLHGRGLIGAGLLDPYKARVLLRLLLAGGADREAVAATFATAGGLSA